MADNGGDNGDNAGVRFPPPLIYLGILLIALAADRHILPLVIAGPIAPLPGWTATVISAWTSVAGIILLVMALGQFQRAGNKPEPWKPADKFIAEGIYKRSRNPMYLGMALVYLGIAFYMQSLFALLLLPMLVWMINKFVITPEEAYLTRRFGQSYLDYKARVRRWI